MRGVPRLAVLAAAVIGDVGHRPRPEQRAGGDQILEPVGPHLAQRVPHAGRLELEHAARVAARQHGVGGCVVQRQAVEVRRVRAGMPARAAGWSAWSGPGSRTSPARPARRISSRTASRACPTSGRGRAAPAPPAAGPRSPARPHGCWRGGTAPPAAAPPPSGGGRPRRPCASAAASARRRSPAAASRAWPGCWGSARPPGSPGRTAGPARGPRRAPRRGPAACRR